SPVQHGSPVWGNNSATTSHTSGNKTTTLTTQLFGLLGDSGYNVTRSTGASWTTGVSSANSGVDEATFEHRGTGAGIAAGTYAATFTTSGSSGSCCCII